MGQPKPMRLEWRSDLPEAELIGASMKEGIAIYVLLQFPDDSAPHYYELPWSQKMARKRIRNHEALTPTRMPRIVARRMELPPSTARQWWHSLLAWLMK